MIIEFINLCLGIFLIALFFGPLVVFIGWVIKVIIEEDRIYEESLEVTGKVLARPWRKLLQDDKKGPKIR